MPSGSPAFHRGHHSGVQLQSTSGRMTMTCACWLERVQMQSFPGGTPKYKAIPHPHGSSTTLLSHVHSFLSTNAFSSPQLFRMRGMETTGRHWTQCSSPDILLCPAPDCPEPAPANILILDVGQERPRVSWPYWKVPEQAALELRCTNGRSACFP